MFKNRLTLVYSILLLSALLMPTFAVAQEEPTAITVYSQQGDNQQTYIIPWFVLDAGGAVEEAISANYRLKDAMGQPVIGKCENANYMLYVGFLAAPEYVEKRLTIDRIQIGSGCLCFSFAIIADIHWPLGSSSTELINQVILWINNNYDAEKIKFVIVDGDLIHGEKAFGYDTDFNDVKNALNNLNHDVPWIPTIGNHDVWCNLESVPVWNSFVWIDPYRDPVSPEKHFENIFGPHYDDLSDILPHWTEQEVPSTGFNNWYDGAKGYPNIYFQNFAFDYCGYHFTCLDQNARDDFKPITYPRYTSFPAGVPPNLYPSLNFGYADLHHDDPAGHGTWQWFIDHLNSCPTIGNENTVIITHHPPAHPNTFPISWYGFDQVDITKINTDLTPMSGYITYWFGGHHHKRDAAWTGLTSSVCPGLTIDSATTSVGPTNNVEPYIQIVQVMGPTNPDLAIYSQWDPNLDSRPDTWDNPDIQLYENPGRGPGSWGPPISSMSLVPGTEYGVEVRLCNIGCTDANGVEVSLIWADWNVMPYYGSHSNIWYWDSSTWISGNVASIDMPSGSGGKVYFKWKTGEKESHYCLVVRIQHPEDPLPSSWNWGFDRPTPGPTNQAGQENTNVKGCKGGTTGEIHIPIENPWDRILYPQIEIIQHVKPGEAEWIFTEVYIPERLLPGETDTIVFTVSPPPDTYGQSREFSINLKDENGSLLGGVMMKVVSDTPPTLGWAGTPGYTDDGVEPDSGDANTKFTFKAKYTDEDNDPPKEDMLLLYIFKGGDPILGSPFVMNEEDPSDTVYANGKIYTYSVTLSKPGEDYTYYYYARDIQDIEAEGPATQIKEGPIVKEVPIPPTSLKEFFVTGDPNGNVYIYWSNNDGTFIRSNIGDVTNSGATPGSCAGAAIADYDHDGDLDVFMGNIDTGAIYLFTNIGSGNFAPPILCTTIPAPLGMDATIADFDNDGEYDYIAVGSNRRDIYIVLNIAPGGPNPTLIWTCGSGHVIDGIDAGDFNEDGIMDFLAVEYWTGSGNEVRLFEGNGDGTFNNPVVAFTAPSAATEGLPAVAVGDFNRDGHLDAIYGHDDGGDPGQAWLYLGDGNGNFAYRGEAYDVNPTGSGANQPGGGLIDAFDFNKDGYLDIVATCCWSGPADDPVKGVYYIPENTPPLPPYFNDPTGPMDTSSIAKSMHAIAAPPLDGRWLVNPGWRIFLNSAGYSDILYCTPPVPNIEYEILSGEWAAALKYDDITNTGLDPTNPFGAQWLTQEFIYPGWPTGSPFKVIEPICTRDNPYNPIAGPDTGHSAIANDQVRIDIEYSMVETSEGTPMGMSPDPESGSFVMSSKHVMLQRYTIKNIGDQTLNHFKFFQFLHAHPKGYGCPEILYDSKRYLPGRPFAGYHYDITLWRQFGTGSHPEATECIGFSSDEPPDYYGLGIYDGHDHGKPDIGLHWHIESADELPGNTHLSDLPAQNRLAGAEGWVLGRLEPNEQVSVRTLLAIHNPLLGAAPDYVDSWTKINKELDELAKVNAATMPSSIKRILVDTLEYAKTSVENGKIAHEAGNDAQAKKYLGVAKNQIESFEHIVKITRRIKPADQEIFLRESAKIKEKMDALIESL